MASLPLNYDIPSIATMRTTVQERFGFVPCNWQVQSAQAQLKQRDVVTLSPTGSGKTLTFWIPLLFNNGGITILITPLTILGEKNVTELQQVQIPVVNLSAATATDATFEDIATRKFRALWIDVMLIDKPACARTSMTFCGTLVEWKNMPRRPFFCMGMSPRASLQLNETDDYLQCHISCLYLSMGPFRWTLAFIYPIITTNLPEVTLRIRKHFCHYYVVGCTFPHAPSFIRSVEKREY
ncbi:hypothetical protein F4604DRAFT_1920024 [Suillus subluteus]|nr:hypothetical protein F4604DRAFT_1920024 [Suillus subluteus]